MASETICNLCGQAVVYSNCDDDVPRHVLDRLSLAAHQAFSCPVATPPTPEPELTGYWPEVHHDH